MFERITRKARDGSEDMEVVEGVPLTNEIDGVWKVEGGAYDGGSCCEVVNHPATAPPACTTHARGSIARPNCFRIWCTPPTPQHII